MSLEIVIISAVVGSITSAITAYVTTRLKMKEEKEKWRREFAIKFAEVQSRDNTEAQKMAVQFAVGILIKNPESPERERIFMPPHCRLIAGRASDNAIVIDDPMLSRHHCAFDADDASAYVEDLGSANAIMLNGERVTGRHKLKSEDLVLLSKMTEFRFHKLDAR
ncbi:MAG TPA: FHA domain-containing protein [Pyrinomonadaceae bacterium]|nr:FHA domain-containing protein [Pyrinomonadaceae bacterium]